MKSLLMYLQKGPEISAPSGETASGESADTPEDAKIVVTRKRMRKKKAATEQVSESAADETPGAGGETASEAVSEAPSDANRDSFENSSEESPQAEGGNAPSTSGKALRRLL